MQTTIILLVEQIVTALGGEFKVILSMILHVLSAVTQIALTAESIHSWESQGG